MTERSACPYDQELGGLMTNSDHSIDAEVAEQVKTEEVYGAYCAWNFYGRVWWDREAQHWKCEVWQFGSPGKVLVADSLEEIMSTASDLYGGR